jgi:uncharacterized protein (TIGR02118 family)
MSVKLVVLFAQPGDPAAFDEHYASTHLPLTAKVPGLQRTETGKVKAAIDGGEQTYYRVTELYFADQGAMRAGFGSDEGKAMAADYQQIAPPGSRMFLVPVDE